MCAWGCLQGPEEGLRSPRVGVRGGCEPPDIGAGNKLRSPARATSAVITEHLSGPITTIISPCEKRVHYAAAQANLKLTILLLQLAEA